MNTSSNTTAGTTRPVTLPLHNLRYATDGETVEGIFEQAPGVVKVYANPATEKVYIEYDATLTNPDQLRAVLQEAGFVQKRPRVICGRCR